MLPFDALQKHRAIFLTVIALGIILNSMNILILNVKKLRKIAHHEV